MKKQSKRIKRDYSKESDIRLEYYGVFFRNKRISIDTKRYKKFFNIPNPKIEKRTTAFYVPSKKHRNDYVCNQFKDELDGIIHDWKNEYKPLIEHIKTPKDVEDDTRVAYLCDGVFDPDEANTIASVSAYKRNNTYIYLVISIYAQFFQQAMAMVDSLIIRILCQHGYKNKDFSRREFDSFIQGKQKGETKSLEELEHYYIYDRAYMVWNFLKHNSLRAYNRLKENYPEMICDPNNTYKHGDPGITVLKIDEEYMISTLNDLKLFFNEICLLCFDSNVDDSDWDYDDYFLTEVNDQIECLENPLGIPDYL